MVASEELWRERAMVLALSSPVKMTTTGIRVQKFAAPCSVARITAMARRKLISLL